MQAFFPITAYHLYLIYCHILEFQSKKSIIFFDRTLFPSVAVKLIESIPNVEVIFLNKYFFLFHKNKKLRLSLVQIKNLTIFSPNSRNLSFIVNSLPTSARVTLSDDGLAPYYFKDAIWDWRSTLNFIKGKSFWKNRLLDLVSPRSVFNFERITSITLYREFRAHDFRSKPSVRYLPISQQVEMAVASSFRKFFDSPAQATCDEATFIFFEPDDFELAECLQILLSRLNRSDCYMKKRFLPSSRRLFDCLRAERKNAVDIWFPVDPILNFTYKLERKTVFSFGFSTALLGPLSSQQALPFDVVLLIPQKESVSYSKAIASSEFYRNWLNKNSDTVMPLFFGNFEDLFNLVSGVIND